MTDILADICKKKLEHIATCKGKVPESALRERALFTSKPRGFKRALEAKLQAGEFGLIAEVKKASPSKGVIREDFDSVVLAKAYATSGAACLSVLTDEPYFQGRDEYLVLAREAVDLPVLRKDFMLDTYQVTEARALGADCVLLIMAALEKSQAQELEAAAFEFGMDVLVEVHDERELDDTLAHLRSRLIGVNNRDLKTLSVDLAISERLVARMPQDALPVCESGIGAHADLLRMRGAGISCFLVGESLMRQADVAAATKALLGIGK